MAKIRKITYANQQTSDLLDEAFGAGRHKRGVYLLRKGQPLDELSFGIFAPQNQSQNQLICAIFFWEIGLPLKSSKAILLGPLAVAKSANNQGLGKMLISHAIKQAKQLKIDAIIVSGAGEYYAKFGFEAVPDLKLPHSGAPSAGLTLQGLELTAGSLKNQKGELVSKS